MIRFDNLFGSGPGQIPLGSTITNATLSVFVTNIDANDFVNLHRMNATWSEASTWNSLTNGIQVNGTEASLASSATIDAGTSGWVTFTNLTSTVQDWLNGQPNFGWALLSNGADGWTFHSSESATVSLRPYLSVSYTSPQLPTMDLDANNSSGTSGANFGTTFTENGGSVLIADTDATLTDSDSTHLTSLTATITNLLDGTAESLSAVTTGTSITASYDSGTGVLTLSGTDTVANYQQVLRTIRYNNTSESPTTTARTVEFIASDAFVSSLTATTTVQIVALNDAPVLDNTGTMVLTTITEDQTTNGGQTVASIIASVSGDRITDVDSGAVEGIAITSLNSGNGTWQYSINNGSSWSDIGTVADSSALLLRSSDLVRFVPDALNATTGSITFRAWDQTGATAGQQGTKVSASTNGGTSPFSSATETASITVTAVNDEQTVSTNTGITVAENSTGSVITNAMLLTTDVDNTAGQLTYTLTSAVSQGTLRLNGVALNNGSTFTQADINSGLVTYDHNGTENFTDAFSFNVDDGAGTTSASTFSITITPVNDNDPTITSNGGGSTASVSIAENTTAVTTVTATDADLPAQTLTYSITGGVDSGLFTIGSSSGVLSFSSARNFETRTDANLDGIYVVTVQVSDGTRTDTQTISVTITDVNEFSVGTVTDSNVATNTVAENATIGTTVGLTAAATDADGTTNTITYSLVNNDGGRFTIDSSTGVVTVAGAINRETDGASRSITVRATSADTSYTDQVFTIAISDVNESPVTTPVDSNGSINSVVENAANGTVVGITAFASDADATTNGVTYSLVNDAGGRFTIHSTTGVLTVADGSLLDFETNSSHAIIVRATSADLSTADQSFTIAVTDANEGGVSAVVDSNAAANSVAENSAIGTTVGITGLATDPDGTDTVTYSLTSDAGGLFTIDPNTGVLPSPELSIEKRLRRTTSRSERPVLIRPSRR